MSCTLPLRAHRPRLVRRSYQNAPAAPGGAGSFAVPAPRAARCGGHPRDSEAEVE